jgi:hypothetical protein
MTDAELIQLLERIEKSHHEAQPVEDADSPPAVAPELLAEAERRRWVVRDSGEPGSSSTVELTSAGVVALDVARAEARAAGGLAQPANSSNVSLNGVNNSTVTISQQRNEGDDGGGSAPWWRRVSRRFFAWTGAIVLGVIAAIIAGLLPDWSGPDRPPTDPSADRSVLVTVDNRVTDGRRGMAEDDQLLRLADEPTLDCLHRDDCAQSEPTYSSGEHLHATCWTGGDRITNGNDSDPRDDRNPGLDASLRWYGVDDGGELRYVSEIWLERQFRGGLDLPRC